MKPVGHDDLSALPPAELSVEPTVSDVGEVEDGALEDGGTTNEPSSSGPTLGEPAIQARRARDESAPAFPNQQRSRQRYKFLGEHGRGGIGRVLKAHDRDLGRQVAIKELLSRGQAHEARFFREVEITARLEHPGIVPVHEAGRWSDGTPFYAMKLVSGRPLRDLLAERPTLEERLGLLHHVIAVADAIAYAHERRIIHRDLKPANIIVGDFGETVVIDWGLAKDLTVSEESSAAANDTTDAGESAPRRSNASNHELTIAGAVLGTPAYMAPEQKYGEPVDQRADVYAIGTMLWELCAIQKVPPSDPAIRHQMLRDAGIDDDFATIINKALEPEPERRYADAGALAADLKAFKSGARIAARSYSLYAVLAHWTRRHRRLALSVLAAIVVLLFGTTLYVRNIAAERDRADAQERRARDAQAAAQTALDELTLNHAQSLVNSDPSAAVDALAMYQGPNVSRAAQIRSEAQARGLAFVRALPHSDLVAWIKVAPDGAIMSLSRDGTIARTSLDGFVSIVARGVAKSGTWGYAATRHVLVYACDPADLCLFDVDRNEKMPVANSAFHLPNAIAMSFAPSQNLLSVLAQDGTLRVFDVKDLSHPALRMTRQFDGPVDAEFVSDDVLVLGRSTGIQLVSMTGEVESIPFEVSRWHVSPQEHSIVLASKDGNATLFEAQAIDKQEHAQLCDGPIADVRIMTDRRVAFGCRSSTIGIWDVAKGTVTQRAQADSHIETINTSLAGDYVIAASGSGSITVIDLYTGLLSTYVGHHSRLAVTEAPTPEHPFIVSADSSGAIRAWRMPPRLVRIITTASAGFQDAIFDRATRTLIGTTRGITALTLVSLASGIRNVEPHDQNDGSLVASTNGTRFVTYGLDDMVEIWAPETMTRSRVFATGHGSVSQVHFIGDSDDFLTAGHDGRIARWSKDGTSQTVAQIKQPLDKFVVMPQGAIVMSTLDGGLWRTQDGAQPVALRPGGARVNQLIAVPGQPLVYAGMASGDVVAIDTRTWDQTVVLRGSGAVQDLAVTDDGRTIAVATSGGSIHVATTANGLSAAKELSWEVLSAHSNHIVLAPDGLLVAPCIDGTIWLYATAQRRALCIVVGIADFTRAVITADGKTVATVDREGRVMSIDLEAARKLLDEQSVIPQPR
ncbi:MAG TPA: serine/threonine-protein kinase [Kofleriaceae bacterium]|nr:serine/threonine-protein kinase [Kofleriaceae bacterium]